MHIAKIYTPENDINHKIIPTTNNIINIKPTS